MARSSYLALALFVMMTTALPNPVSSPGDLTISSTSASEADSFRPFIPRELQKIHRESLSKRWVRCDKDTAGYVTGATTWDYYYKGLCRSLFSGDFWAMDPNPQVVQIDGGGRTLIAKLSAEGGGPRGYNDVGMGVYKPGSLTNATVSLTQAQCRKGFKDIVDLATRDPTCQGYSGRKNGDGMGGFFGGGSGRGGAANPEIPDTPEFYMWIDRPSGYP